jgi:hypothetical protein
MSTTTINKNINNLLCTKACNAVSTPYKETNQYGVCYREVCFFAHSQEELKIPKCKFGYNCRYFWTTEGNPDSACKFSHEDEHLDDYLKRTLIMDSNLPKTDKFSRVKPSKLESVNVPNIPKGPSKISVPVCSYTFSWTDKIPVSTNENKIPIDIQISPEKKLSKWDIKTSEISEVSSDDYKSPLKSKSKKEKNHCFVIRVPNNEIAEIAIKAAFDRGQFDIQILIE